MSVNTTAFIILLLLSLATAVEFQQVEGQNFKLKTEGNIKLSTSG